MAGRAVPSHATLSRERLFGPQQIGWAEPKASRRSLGAFRMRRPHDHRLLPQPARGESISNSVLQDGLAASEREWIWRLVRLLTVSFRVRDMLVRREVKLHLAGRARTIATPLAGRNIQIQ